jgi:alpha-tubulin suppressor-like RCC1 family protein
MMPYQLSVIALGQPVTALALGDYHTCALGANGSVQCWGLNDHGQLGLGNTLNIGANEVPSLAVSTVPLGVPATAIAAGQDTTCALLTDGTVRCWGKNNYGQLGVGSTNDVGDNELPTAANAQVSLGGTASFIAVAGDQTCAALSSGPIRCWGYNAYNQLLTNDTNNIGDTPTDLPYQVPASIAAPLSPVISLTSGGWRAAALYEDGYAEAWGYNDDGGLCNGKASPSAFLYVQGQSTAAAIASGLQSLCIRGYDYSMTCMGLCSKGQLGQPNLECPEYAGSIPPIDFGTAPDGSQVFPTQMAAGQLHTCVLLNTSEVKCWGYNNQGQLGLGYASQPPTDYVGGDPTTVPALLDAILVLPPSF